MYFNFWCSGMQSIQFPVLHFFPQWYGLSQRSRHPGLCCSRPWPIASPSFLLSQCSHCLWSCGPVTSSLWKGYLWAFCSWVFQLVCHYDFDLCFHCILWIKSHVALSLCSFWMISYRTWSKPLACDSWIRVEWYGNIQHNVLSIQQSLHIYNRTIL